MHTAPATVQKASRPSKFPVNFHASTQPAQTGTMAAGRVFGRVASRSGTITPGTSPPRRFLPSKEPGGDGSQGPFEPV